MTDRKWPGNWRYAPPTVDEHLPGEELAWVARGYPFNRPVLARSNVGVRKRPYEVDPETEEIRPLFEQFVRVELMADSFHGQDANLFGWFKGLEWLGPVALPREGDPG
mgnify:CR=1 FL=1